MGAYTLGNQPHDMKASMSNDPGTPRLHEEMSGEHQDYFLTSIGKEIEESEQQNTWKLVKKNSLPRGSNLLSSTLAFNIKIYPDGRIRNHKAKVCVRGDRQIKNLDYFESYSPV